MVRRGISAIGRAPSAEANRLFDEFFGDWQPESFQRAFAHLSAAEEEQWFVGTREYAKKYAEKFHKRVMRAMQKASATKRSQNLADGNRWICEQYDQRTSRDRKYPVSLIYKALYHRQLKMPPEFQSRFYPNGELVEYETIRRIIRNRRGSRAIRSNSSNESR